MLVSSQTGPSCCLINHNLAYNHVRNRLAHERLQRDANPIWSTPRTIFYADNLSAMGTSQTTTAFTSPQDPAAQVEPSQAGSSFLPAHLNYTYHHTNNHLYQKRPLSDANPSSTLSRF